MNDKELIAMLLGQVQILTSENTMFRNTLSIQEKALGLAADMLIKEQNKSKFLQEKLYQERRCINR